jgi:hypothetical protein
LLSAANTNTHYTEYIKQAGIDPYLVIGQWFAATVCQNLGQFVFADLARLLLVEHGERAAYRRFRIGA